MREKFAKATLAQGVGEPSECAEAYLVCLKSWFMTAQEVVVDGRALAVNSM